MSAISIPSVGGSVTPGRFLVTAAGAAAGMSLLAPIVIPHVPAAIRSFSFGPITGEGLALGACALLGAAAANMAFNKIG